MVGHLILSEFRRFSHTSTWVHYGLPILPTSKHAPSTSLSLSLSLSLSHCLIYTVSPCPFLPKLPLHILPSSSQVTLCSLFTVAMAQPPTLANPDNYLLPQVHMTFKEFADQATRMHFNCLELVDEPHMYYEYCRFVLAGLLPPPQPGPLQRVHVDVYDPLPPVDEVHFTTAYSHFFGFCESVPYSETVHIYPTPRQCPWPLHVTSLGIKTEITPLVSFFLVQLPPPCCLMIWRTTVFSDARIGASSYYPLCFSRLFS